MTAASSCCCRPCVGRLVAGRGRAARRPRAERAGIAQFQRHHRPPLAVAQGVQRQVVGDGEQPGGELGLRACTSCECGRRAGTPPGPGPRPPPALPTRWCMTATRRCWYCSTSSPNAAASSSRTRSISRMSGSRRAICALVSPIGHDSRGSGDRGQDTGVTRRSQTTGIRCPGLTETISGCCPTPVPDSRSWFAAPPCAAAGRTRRRSRRPCACAPSR